MSCDQRAPPASGMLRLQFIVPKFDRYSRISTKYRRSRAQAILIAGVAAGCLSAAPASATPFNCFEWVRVSTSHLIHPHRRPHAHRAAPVPRRHIVHAHVVPRVHRIASALERRPIACPEHETVLASPIPGAPPPETLAMLKRDLAGPAIPATEAGEDTAAVVPVDTGPPGVLFPGGPIGGPGGVDIFGPPATPGGPPPVVIVGPPVVGPPVPPDTEFPVTPTPTPTPPDVVPPLTPPDIFPVVVPPGQVSGPGPVTGPSGSVPEPSAWALMLVGLGAIGAALRARRHVALEPGPAQAQS